MHPSMSQKDLRVIFSRVTYLIILVTVPSRPAKLLNQVSFVTINWRSLGADTYKEEFEYATYGAM